MADYVRGAKIPNAIAYELRERIGITAPNGTDKTAYIHIDTKFVGKVKYTNKGYIGTDGKVTGVDSGWAHSDMLNINDLANVDGTVDCVSAFTPSEDKYAIAVYAKKDDYDSFITGYLYDDFGGDTSIDTLKSIIGYDYVVFCQAKPEIWANHKGELEFRLDDYADKLGVRKTNTLVVRAIGDGVNYSNSPYSDSRYYNNDFYKG